MPSLGVAKFGHQLRLDLRFGRESGIEGQARERTALDQQGVNVRRWCGDQSIKERGLAAVAAEVAAVEQAIAASLNQQRVGVIG